MVTVDPFVNCAPLAGPVKLITGALSTLIAIAVEVVTAPELSVALAVRE